MKCLLFFQDGPRADIFEWLESVVIANLYNTEHYNEEAVSANDSRFLTDFYSFRLGPPRLRLLRVEDDPCYASVHVRSKCIVDYTLKTEDKRNYIPGWVVIDNHTVSPQSNYAHLDAFKYQSQAELKGQPFWAERTWFSGGGYVANLGENATFATQLLHNLTRDDWLDQHARALFVEFNILNVNTNLFNLVTICFELPTEGASLSYVSIQSVKLYRCYDLIHLQTICTCT